VQVSYQKEAKVSNLKKRFAVLGSLLLTLVLVLSVVLPVSILARTTYPLQATDAEVANALTYLHGEQTADGGIGGFAPSAWVTMAIAAAGEDPHDWKVEGNSVVDYLAANASDADSATDYARMILAIEVANEDPASFGGRNFIELLEDSYDGTQIGDTSLLNDDFWGVMALISAGESPGSEIVANSVAFIKGNQNTTDGGWSWAVEGDSGVDDTAAAIMALIAVGEDSNSSVITDGLAYIKSQQTDNGGFLSWGATNAETDSQAIDAIVAAGQDPASDAWTKSGKNPVDDLLSFRQDSGQFYWQIDNPGAWPSKTTASAIPALLGKPYSAKVSIQPQVAAWPLYVAIGIAAALLVGLLMFLTRRRKRG
jgi:iron complex transport system substrate-binding protein